MIYYVVTRCTPKMKTSMIHIFCGFYGINYLFLPRVYTCDDAQRLNSHKEKLFSLLILFLTNYKVGVTVRILTVFKAGRLLNIDLFLDWSIEEGTFHVHLIKLKAMVSSIG